MTPVTSTSLPNINEQVARLRKEYREELRSHRRLYRENLRVRIANIESNRQAAALLDAAGFEVGTSSYGEPGEWLYVKLGDGYSTRANQRRVEAAKLLIAQTLGCHLEEYDKKVSNGRKREVTITLRPSKFPGVRVEFLAKLPPEARCKIVKNRHRSSSYVTYDVVCEMPAGVRQ